MNYKHEEVYSSKRVLTQRNPIASVHYIKIQMRTLVLSLLAIAVIASVIFTQLFGTLQTRAAEPTATEFCTADTWKPVPDFLKGNNGLGTEKKKFPPDYFDEEKRDAIEPGPVIEKGQEAATSRYKNDGSLDWAVDHGVKLPVKYVPANDLTRYEFSGRNFAESNWSRFVRRMDDSYFTVHSSEASSKQISTGVFMKYEIIRLARDGVHTIAGLDGDMNVANKQIQDYKEGKLHASTNMSIHGRLIDGELITPQLVSEVVGFDVTGLDLTQWTAANEAERVARMIEETKGCGANMPTPQPTSTQPVSCTEHLVLPPADFSVNIPSVTPNICAAASEYDPETGHRKAEELFRCGDYWVTAWCNASNDTQRQDVVYACRGWSQTGDGAPNGQNSFFRYFPNRISTVTTSQGINGSGGALLSNINKYGDVQGRRVTWNSLMTELKSGAIAFPYGYKDTAGALQAAAAAIFDKPWGAVAEQERLNNCSTTWDGTVTTVTATTPTITPQATSVPSVTPVITPTNTPTPSPTPIKSGPTPTVTPTPTPTKSPVQSPTPTPTPVVSSISTMTTTPIQSGPTPTVSQKKISRFTPKVEAPQKPTALKANEKTFEQKVGKEGNGKYFKPLAIVYRDILYVFIIGDGSSETPIDWYNAFEMKYDGSSWTSFENIRGNFNTGIRAHMKDNNTPMEIFGKGRDTDIYAYAITSSGRVNRQWAAIHPDNLSYQKSKSQSQVTYKGEQYTFSVTSDGKLKVCTGQACSAE